MGLKFNPITGQLDMVGAAGGGGGGTGDVVGPAGATANNIVLFDGLTGKVIKDGGQGLPAGTLVGTTDTQTLTNKTLSSPAITTPTGIVKGDVGLGNVDNTSDANKPVSTAQQTALNGKFTQRTITGTTNQITVTNGDGVSGNPTLALPQDIHTGASPTFARLNLNGTAYLDGATAGAVKVTGTLYTNGRASIGGIVPVTRLHLSDGSASGLGATPQNRGMGITGANGYARIYYECVGSTSGKRVFVMDNEGGYWSIGSLSDDANYWVTQNILRLRYDGAITTKGSVSGATDSTYTLGTSSLYWSNTYTDRLYLNSTAYLDGATAGIITTTGDLRVTTAGTNSASVVTVGGTQTLTNKTLTGGLVTADPSAALGIASKQYVDAYSTTTQTRNETPSGTINGSNVTFTTAATPTTSSLRLYLNGIRLKPAGADYTLSGSTITMVTAPATSSVLLADYEVSAGTFAHGVNNFITNEVPTGTVNSSNVNFTTAQSYIAGTLQVYINGLKQLRTTHYTETTPASGTFAMSDAPATGDVIEVSYQHTLSSTGAADTVDGYHADDLSPIGSLLIYAGTAVPSANWLFCYGQAISRTTYATLFSRLSTTYGVGDGSTTFNVPDMRGRVAAGQDDMGGSSANRLTGTSGSVNGDTLGGTGGTETHTLTTTEMPSHKHSSARGFYTYVGTGGAYSIPGGANLEYTDAIPSGADTSNTGSDGAHNNVQPTIILNYIIKAL